MKRMTLDQNTYKILCDVNADGNQIVWTPDTTVWGVVERWDFPRDVKGHLIEDCDGITLWKMDRLLKAGLPAECLLFTICICETGEVHAVLCVTTDRGDFILDNRQRTVMTYDQLLKIGYVFKYRSKIGGKLTDQWDKIKQV
jgi:predicted transglutaminase-like cysteine proteinase